MSQFAFLADDFPVLYKYAAKAETHALSDPRGACFWARLTLETALKWIYRTDPALRRVYTDTLAAMIAEPSLEALTGPQQHTDLQTGVARFVAWYRGYYEV